MFGSLLGLVYSISGHSLCRKLRMYRLRGMYVWCTMGIRACIYSCPRIYGIHRQLRMPTHIWCTHRHTRMHTRLRMHVFCTHRLMRMRLRMHVCSGRQCNPPPEGRPSPAASAPCFLHAFAATAARIAAMARAVATAVAAAFADSASLAARAEATI